MADQQSKQYPTREALLEAMRLRAPSLREKGYDGTAEMLEEAITYISNERCAIPVGWKLVPIEPTLAMECAYRQSLNDYIDRLPPEQKKLARKGGRGKYSGARVNDAALKLKLRWRAMLAAAPEAP